MSDLISRQAAIDAVIKRDANCGIDSAEVLKTLPSAQPEQQRLSDWKEDFKDYVNALILPRDDYNVIMEYIDEVPPAQPDIDEWCTDCSEYDSERHCCPRFNRVIRDAVKEVGEKIIYCSDCKHWNELLNLCKRTKHMALGVNGFCSKAERREG